MIVFDSTHDPLHLMVYPRAYELTAILWVNPTPWPIQTFGTMEEADSWLRLKLEQAGTPLPALGPSWWMPAVVRAHVRPVTAKTA